MASARVLFVSFWALFWPALAHAEGGLTTTKTLLFFESQTTLVNHADENLYLCTHALQTTMLGFPLRRQVLGYVLAPYRCDSLRFSTISPARLEKAQHGGLVPEHINPIARLGPWRFIAGHLFWLVCLLPLGLFGLRLRNSRRLQARFERLRHQS